MKRIYFDNGSTSFPKAPGAAEAVSEMLLKGAFNINRGSYAGAYEVAGMVLETREQLAGLFGAESSKQVVFTPGITWSINMLLHGLLKKGEHVVVSGMEHNAVMRPLYELSKRGVCFDTAQAEPDGFVRPEAVEEKIRPETKLVLMLHASNVCGTILPVREIGEICRKHGVFFAVDTAQSAGSIPVRMTGYGIDFLAFTGHKGLLGPQGIGGFLISDKLDKELRPVVCGGTGSSSDSYEQPACLPDKYESGTMNLPGIAGLHASLAYIERTGLDTIEKKKMELTGQFLKGTAGIPGIRIAGRMGTTGRTAVVSLDFTGQDNALAAFMLEQEYGIMTRVGLHCAPAAHRSLGTFPQGTVRFSFGYANTEEEIAYGIRAVREIAERIK